jgi:hypothetical protein
MKLWIHPATRRLTNRPSRCDFSPTERNNIPYDCSTQNSSRVTVEAAGSGIQLLSSVLQLDSKLAPAGALPPHQRR